MGKPPKAPPTKPKSSRKNGTDENTDASLDIRIPAVGDRVWVVDPTDAYKIATARSVTLSSGECMVEVVDDKYKTSVVAASATSPVNPSSQDGAMDSTQLMYLHDPSLLHNVRVRYAQQDIHTYTAHILVVINPYQRLSIYDAVTMHRYEGRPIGALPPHVFAMADRAYRQMKSQHCDQSVVVSGESGAGKTETCKLVMRYFSFVGRGDADSDASASMRDIETKVMQVNPVLEAFGNAKTLRNNNSSRFGKFTEMRFDGAAKLVGASVETYLLEKPRVVAPAEGERTFHVFYQLVAGASAADRGRWHLDNNATASDFDVLARGHCTSIGGVDDAADFTEMRTALGTVGFAPEECASVFDVIAALLHLGNVSFEGTAARSATPSSRLSDVGRNAAAHVSVLLGIRESLLCERLTLRIINAGGPKARTQGSRSGAGDTMKIPLSPLDAEFARDALAKYIYARLVFPWLVHRINSCLPRDDAVSAALIGILDIAGFEVFERNGFEQLCINHANEQIQQYFNRQILLQEQDIYELEGLRYRRVEFHDNTTTIDLLEERSQGILALLDEECVMPKATDKTFTNKVHTIHRGSPSLGRPDRTCPLKEDDAFVVRHFAGDVMYATAGFLDKNNDALHDSLQEVLTTTESDFVRVLLDLDASDSQVGGGRSPSKSGRVKSVARRFRTQLASLLTRLNSAPSTFIRCIKPNMQQVPRIFDGPMVMNQLRCSGMCAAVRLMQAGFPTRCPFDSLFSRYAPKMPYAIANLKPALFCEALLVALDLSPKDFQIGLTKVFFRPGKMAVLEELLSTDSEEKIQSVVARVKRWLARRRFRSAIHSVLAFERMRRRLVGIRALKKLQRAVRIVVRMRPWFRILRRSRARLMERRRAEQLEAEREADRKRAEEEAARELEARQKRELEEKLERDHRLAELRRQQEEEHSKRAEYEKELQATRKAVSAFDGERLTWQTEREGLLARVDEAVAQVATAAQNKAALESQLGELQSAKDQLQQETTAAQAARTALELRVRTMEEQRESELTQRSEDTSEMQRALDDAITSRQELELRLQDAEQRLGAQTRLVEEGRATIASEREERSAVERLLKVSETERVALVSSHEAECVAHTQQLEMVTQARVRLEGRAEELGEQLRELRQEQQSMREELAAAKSSASTATERVSTLEAQRAEEQRMHQMEASSVDRELGVALATRQELDLKLQSAQHEAHRAQETLSAVRTELASEHSLRDANDQRVRELESQLESMRGEHQLALSSLSQQLGVATGSSQVLRSRIEELERTLAAQVSTHDALTTEASTLRARCALLESRSETLERQRAEAQTLREGTGTRLQAQLRESTKHRLRLDGLLQAAHAAHRRDVALLGLLRWRVQVKLIAFNRLQAENHEQTAALMARVHTSEDLAREKSAAHEQLRLEMVGLERLNAINMEASTREADWQLQSMRREADAIAQELDLERERYATLEEKVSMLERARRVLQWQQSAERARLQRSEQEWRQRWENEQATAMAALQERDELRQRVAVLTAAMPKRRRERSHQSKGGMMVQGTGIVGLDDGDDDHGNSEAVPAAVVVERDQLRARVARLEQEAGTAESERNKLEEDVAHNEEVLEELHRMLQLAVEEARQLRESAAAAAAGGSAGAGGLLVDAAGGGSRTQRLSVTAPGQCDACSSSRRPLHEASVHGHGACVVAAIKGLQSSKGATMLLGEQMDELDDNNATAIHVAASAGSEECLRLLVEAGANLERRDDMKRTALHRAAMKGHTKVVEQLVRMRVALDKIDERGKTPLDIAAALGHVDAAAALARAGAKLAGGNGTRGSPMHVAAERGDVAMLEALIRAGASVNDADVNGRSPVYVAASYGQTDALKVLLEHDATPDALVEGGHAPLYAAASDGRTGVMKLLLEGGADPNAHYEVDGWNVLHKCASAGLADCVRLLAASAHVNATTNDGSHMTALHMAVRGQHEAVVDSLLGCGAEPDVRDNNDRTPLHHAILMGHTGLVRTLLDNDASVLLRTKDGTTTMDMADDCGVDEIVELIETATQEQRELQNELDSGISEEEAGQPTSESAMDADAPLATSISSGTTTSTAVPMLRGSHRRRRQSITHTGAGVGAAAGGSRRERRGSVFRAPTTVTLRLHGQTIGGVRVRVEDTVNEMLTNASIALKTPGVTYSMLVDESGVAVDDTSLLERGEIIYAT